MNENVPSSCCFLKVFIQRPREASKMKQKILDICDSVLCASYVPTTSINHQHRQWITPTPLQLLMCSPTLSYTGCEQKIFDAPPMYKFP